MTTDSNVVITGVGVVSPIGIGRVDYWHALASGKSGVRLLPRLADLDSPIRIGAPVLDFQPRQYVKPRKALKVMSREIQLGFTAATLAVQDGQLAVDQLDPDRFGVIYGSEMLYCEPEELISVCQRCMPNDSFDFALWGNAFMAEMYPLWMLKYLPNMTACHIGISHDARGPNNTICLGDASGLLAMMEAARIIRRGRADVMIAGGTSSRVSTTPLVYRGIAKVSPGKDQPERASRPFDANRDGLVDGEGAGAVILENEEYARRRGARILARLSGWQVRFGAVGTGNDHENAIAHAATGAMHDAGVQPDDLDHVNAHATSTQDGDAVEARAIQRAVGEVPVLAPKSYFGHLGAGGSVVELIASILSLEAGTVPPTLNYETPDPACPVNVIHGAAHTVEHPHALVLSQSTTGQAAAMVLQINDELDG